MMMRGEFEEDRKISGGFFNFFFNGEQLRYVKSKSIHHIFATFFIGFSSFFFWLYFGILLQYLMVEYGKLQIVVESFQQELVLCRTVPRVCMSQESRG